MAKKMIDECLETWDVDVFKRPLDVLIEWLSNQLSECREAGYPDPRVGMELDCEGGAEEYTLWGSREETQREAEAREAEKLYNKENRKRHAYQDELATRLLRMTNDQIIQCLNIVGGKKEENDV